MAAWPTRITWPGSRVPSTRPIAASATSGKRSSRPGGDPARSSACGWIAAAHAEIRVQRARIGDLLGQLRDTHREHDSDTTERLATDTDALKQRVRDLTAQQRTLEERLQAARSNNRFLDKRIAGLEAQLLAAQPGS